MAMRENAPAKHSSGQYASQPQPSMVNGTIHPTLGLTTAANLRGKSHTL